MKCLVIAAFLVACAQAVEVDERVVGGVPTERGLHPSVATLLWCFNDICQHLCMATIIGQSSAVTAAHCILEAPTFGTLAVRAGILNLSDPTGVGQTLEVANSILHPDYGGGIGPHDIAVVQLIGLLTYNTFVLPAALPSPGQIPSGNAILAGWGAIANNPQIFPDTLHAVPKTIISFEACAGALIDLFGTSNPLTPNNTCSGPLLGGIASCSGDSGGGLLQGNLFVGVVSWGITPCGFPGAPSIYGRVSSYIDFISDSLL